MSVRLYVGNLPEATSREDLEGVFADVANAVSIKLITDRKTNKCRGFGFVTVKTEEEADDLIAKYNGHQIQENTIKLERAQPKAKEEDSPEAARTNNTKKPSGNAATKQRRVATETESLQPDPRWAQDLEKLKQLLSAQAANP
jgi:RNA recognition motif-containing protein